MDNLPSYTYINYLITSGGKNERKNKRISK